MSNIKIINATVENFAIEIFDSAPASGSAGDHQDGRIVKYLKNMYMWHNDVADWIKFPNLEDYENFQSDLSTQEVARATAVSSLATKDAALSTELASIASDRGTAITSLQAARSTAVSSLETAYSSEDAALSTALVNAISSREDDVSAEKARQEASYAVLSTALVNTISSREDDVSAEKARQEASYAVLSTALVNAISSREDDVSAEKARAEAAEADISSNLSSEISTAASADASLEYRLSVQEAARSAEYSTLEALEATNSASRSQEHSTIQASIDAVDSQLDAILAASSADLDQFAEVVSYINAISVTQSGQVSTEISELNSAISSLETARSSEDSLLQGSIESLELARSQQDAAVASNIASLEAAYSAEDAALSTAVSSEASTEASVVSSLQTEIAAQETLRNNEYSTLTANISAESATRSTAEANFSQNLSTEESLEASHEASLEALLTSLEEALSTEDAAISSELATQITNRGTDVSSLNTDIANQVSSLELARSQQDSVVASSIASLEVAYASEDATLSAAVSSEASTEASVISSLQTEIAAQETLRNNEYSTLTASVGSLEVVYSNEDAALATAISTEGSRITSMLADASIYDGETLDTFVELVSFLTVVDTDSDNALDSYITSIDSNIAVEVSNLNSVEAAQSNQLSTQISASGSILAAETSRAGSAEDSLESNISALESVENARHLRIDFTNATSLTVADTDLPSGYTVGNGMVQVFHEVTTGTYRHLVAPATFNPSTGAMTFDLGSTAKDGFAVFYSFAGDDQASGGFELPGSSTGSSTSSSTDPQHKITAIDVSNLSFTSGGSSSVTFTISGAGSQQQAERYYDLTKTYTNSIPGLSAAYGDGYTPNSSVINVSGSWNAGYTELTFSWTNDQNASASSGLYYYTFHWGQAGQYEVMKVQFRVNESDGTLNTTSAAGKSIADTGYVLVSPTYFDSSNGVYSYVSNGLPAGATNSGGGPTFGFAVEDFFNENQCYNFLPYGSSYSAPWTIMGGGVRWVTGGSQKYMEWYIPSTSRLYSELTNNATAQTTSNSARVVLHHASTASGGLGYYAVSMYYHVQSATVPQPDANTDIEFFFPANYSQNKFAGSAFTPTDAQTDLKIVISVGDRTASNMTVKFYRSDASLSSPSWTEVTKAYLAGHDFD